MKQYRIKDSKGNTVGYASANDEKSALVKVLKVKNKDAKQEFDNVISDLKDCISDLTRANSLSISDKKEYITNCIRSIKKVLEELILINKGL